MDVSEPRRTIDAGVPPEAVLARHPHLRAELAPLILLARTLRGLPARPLSPGARDAIRTELGRVEEAMSRRPRRHVAAFGHRLAWWAALAAAVVTLVLSATAFAAAMALPGDPLFTVRQAVESAWLAAAPNETIATRRALELAHRRLEEAALKVARGDDPAPALAALDALGPLIAGSPASAAAIAVERRTFGTAPQRPGDSQRALAPPPSTSVARSGSASPGRVPIPRAEAGSPRHPDARAPARPPERGLPSEPGPPTAVPAPAQAAPTPVPPHRGLPPGRGDPPGQPQPTEPPAIAPTPRPPALTPTALPPTTAAPAAPSGASGLVADVAGSPLSGVRVQAELLPDGQGRFSLITTNAEGKFELWFAPGRYRLSAVADGYTPQWFRAAGRPEDASEVLVEDGRMTGSIDFTLVSSSTPPPDTPSPTPDGGPVATPTAGADRD